MNENTQTQYIPNILRVCIFITLLRLYLNKVTVRSYSTRGKPLLTVKVDRHRQ